MTVKDRALQSIHRERKIKKKKERKRNQSIVHTGGSLKVQHIPSLAGNLNETDQHRDCLTAMAPRRTKTPTALGSGWQCKYTRRIHEEERSSGEGEKRVGSGEKEENRELWTMTSPLPNMTSNHWLLSRFIETKDDKLFGLFPPATQDCPSTSIYRGPFIYSTPCPSTLPPSPVKEPSFRPLSMATISARISRTSLGTVLSYIEIRSLGCGYTLRAL